MKNIPIYMVIMKKVTFNENKNKIHQTFVWTFAYRQARKSNFQQLALDRHRFQRRIRKMEFIIGMVLECSHRDNIYRERFVHLKM